MKSFGFLVLCFVGFHYCQAQDTTVHFSTSIFDSRQDIELHRPDRWPFHKGNDPARAEPGLNMTGWKKVQPARIYRQRHSRPDQVKIFRSFFTAKTTGGGTGLGLSLSYDIVKANGEEIEPESKEGEGSEFIIQIPET